MKRIFDANCIDVLRKNGMASASALPRGAGLGGVFRQLHLVALVIEDFEEQFANAQFVVHHQNICHIAC